MFVLSNTFHSPRFYLLFLICLEIGRVLTDTKDDFVFLSTPIGNLTGRNTVSSQGRKYTSFMGIPYAKPPVGELRFQNPQVYPEPWEKNVDASGVRSPLCIQGNKYSGHTELSIGTEDCLYLNVYTHDTNGKAPVMIHIHGGGFYWGAPGNMYSTAFLMNKDIVLVTLAYRLGPFGFLTTEDDVIPGNFGLKDQAMAVKWVKRNIEYFGGDSNSITVFGESAGGASAIYLMASPLTRDIVTRGIAESGSILSSWASGKGKMMAYAVGGFLKCPIQPHKELLNCLRNRNASELASLQSNSMVPFSIIVQPLFKPVVEVDHSEAFLTTNPINIHLTKPLLTGVASNEGGFLAAIFSRASEKEKLALMNDLDAFLPSILDYIGKIDDINKLTEKVKEKFMNGRNVSQGLFDAFGSYYFYWPALKQIMNKDGPTYQYLYNHKGCNSLSQSLTRSGIDFGVIHIDEFYLLFNITSIYAPSKANPCEKDVKYSNILIDLWTNFATYGDPTPEGSQFKWEESEKGSKQLIIGDKIKMGPTSDNMREALDFWDSLTYVYDKH